MPITAGFSRGVNLSQWLDTFARGAIPPEELAALRQAGFDHVRLPIDPMTLGWDRAAGPELAQVGRLHEALAAIQAAGLNLVVDMHLDGGLQHEVEEGGIAADQLAEVWAWLGLELRSTDPARVAVELLNEPQYPGAGGALQWDVYQRRLLGTVRAALPDHLIVVTGRQAGTLEGLVELVPYEDDNLVYSLHYYAPPILTHQGASWMRNVPWSTAGHWHDVHYPALHAYKELAWLEGTPDFWRAQAERHDYFADHWDASKVAETWRPVIDWANRYPGVRVRMGEFGVFRPQVSPDARYGWIADVRRQAESLGWDWCLWNYASDFGITTRSNTSGADRGVLEIQALRALGLNAEVASAAGASGCCACRRRVRI